MILNSYPNLALGKPISVKSIILIGSFWNVNQTVPYKSVSVIITRWYFSKFQCRLFHGNVRCISRELVRSFQTNCWTLLRLDHECLFPAV